MVDDWQTMYDEFSDKGAHSAEWFEIAKNFLKLVFAGDHRESKCPCNSVRTEGYCPSMKWLATLLSKDLCRTVTTSFKAKTECIALCVSGSSFTHTVTNSEVNSITSVYYIDSYYKTF
jgi:hypothetical protein